ncbi:probable serine/threonine-protein kinase PIX13 [Lactuca sativa]|uniref:probable serine/threonine-protein kinase PIX13 n=1 Tax=Lactuca sativa TaxID=4236 RepID=UPI000CD83EEF|nr:probable serine/threonine-protein kinase PIX13 [Lactuca sativa]
MDGIEFFKECSIPLHRTTLTSFLFLTKETNNYIPSMIPSYQTGVSMAEQSNTTLTGFAIKSEIYAFGVVLLEILTGMKVYDIRRPFRKHKLVEWAIPLLADEVNLSVIMDPRLQNIDCPPKEAFMFAQLISNCLQAKQDKRPSMEYIAHGLHHCYQNEIKTV